MIKFSIFLNFRYLKTHIVCPNLVCLKLTKNNIKISLHKFFYKFFLWYDKIVPHVQFIYKSLRHWLNNKTINNLYKIFLYCSSKKWNHCTIKICKFCKFCVAFTRNFFSILHNSMISFSFRCRRWAFSYFWGKSRMCCNVILVFVVKAGSSSSITSERSSSDTSSQQSFHVTRINTFWVTIVTFKMYSPNCSLYC